MRRVPELMLFPGSLLALEKYLSYMAFTAKPTMALLCLEGCPLASRCGDALGKWGWAQAVDAMSRP